MKKRRAIRVLLFLAVIGGLGVGAALGLGDKSSRQEFRTAKVTRGDIADVVAATGTLNPAKVVTVGTQVSGQVSKLSVQLNDKVKAGQLLAEIDPTLLLAQIKQDQTSLESARINYEQAARDLKRTRVLLAKDYVAQVDLEHAEQSYVVAKNGYESAKTVVERDEANLNYAKIVAPIDGVVIAKDVELGQTLAASFQTPNLFKIAGNLTQMKIDVNLPEAFISKVKAGMAAKFTVDAFPDREFEGTVSTVDLNPNNQSGGVTYGIEIAVDNPGRELLPGMTAYVNLTVSKKEKVLRVPASALRFVPPAVPVTGWERLLGKRAPPPVMFAGGKDSKTIYLLRNDQPTPVSVKTGATDDEYIEVSGNGIGEGDTVIVGVSHTEE